MTKSIHPKMQTLTVECSNGFIFTTEWTGQAETIRLHTDPYNHPAWTGETTLNVSKGRAGKFMRKMGGK